MTGRTSKLGRRGNMTFRNAFLQWASNRFPELRTEWMGDSRQMRVVLAFRSFLTCTQVAIDQEQHDEASEYFKMADRVLANAYPEMQSLFHAMYVEHLRFADDQRFNRSWALEKLTPRLRDAYLSSIPGSTLSRKR